MKKLLILVAALLLAALPALAASTRVIDKADLLTAQEEAQLEQTIAAIGEAHQFDVVILFERNADYREAKHYAADFYDYGDYGYGSNKDGILFFLDIGKRDYFMLTTGQGIRAFTDYGQKQISADVQPYLSRGDYGTAMTRFLDHVERYLVQAENGQPYDIGSRKPRSAPAQRLKQAAPMILIGAAVIALIVALRLKGQLKTVRRQPGAAAYVEKDSFNLTRVQDIYLYTTTHRQKIESSSSGGSSTFRGSSGRSHGGSGGKF